MITDFFYWNKDDLLLRFTNHYCGSNKHLIESITFTYRMLKFFYTMKYMKVLQFLELIFAL